jgi:arylsulfatase A-like enzyme
MDPGLAAACRLDQQVGEFLEWLQVGRHWDQSLIVITSDMGCVSEHRGNQIAGPLDLHESLTHLPLLVRYPGIEPAGRSSALVQSIDLTPTVFDAIGVAVPIAIDGSSLLPICRHERKSLRDCARLAIAGGPRAIRTTNWYLIESDRSLDEIETAELRLFLKPVDRWEHDDVAKQYPEVVAELSQLLEAYSTVTSAFADSQRLGRSATEKW